MFNKFTQSLESVVMQDLLYYNLQSFHFIECKICLFDIGTKHFRAYLRNAGNGNIGLTGDRGVRIGHNLVTRVLYKTKFISDW